MKLENLFAENVFEFVLEVGPPDRLSGENHLKTGRVCR